MRLTTQMWSEAAEALDKMAVALTALGAAVGGGYGLTAFPHACCYLSLGSVAVCWSAVILFVKEEGWHFSYLVCYVVPLMAAYRGVPGKHEIRADVRTGVTNHVVGAVPDSPVS
ncbi:hypothetical protein N8I84_28930 [Streptomyces cynarae]|uniref:Integral membrane protein n=1 Tax=Streptomyces cynarae TaxID=2981134 RepID=A0ABY6E8Z9_9ACTN|nr:hypothetical protein [Streptomyces cynarae]UXY22271.1 hypothetical protein N8I84_28930 [Streptomyces cynarae]